jgi:hypothetical protein
MSPWITALVSFFAVERGECTDAPHARLFLADCLGGTDCLEALAAKSRAWANSTSVASPSRKYRKRRNSASSAGVGGA